VKRHLAVKITESILLLPGTLTLGLMVTVGSLALVTGGLPGMAQVAVEHGLIVGIASGMFALVLGLFFTIPAAGFVLLWYLVWCGAEYFTSRKVVGFLALVISLLSIIIGGWLMIGTGSKSEFMLVLTLPPLILGVLHSIELGWALTKSVN